MSKKQIGRTDIEYAAFPDGKPGYSWNWFEGCANGPEVCPVQEKCWARSMAKWFGRDFTPHLVPERLLDPLTPHKPGIWLVNFTGDTCGPWVDPDKLFDTDILFNTGDMRHRVKPLKTIIFEIMDKCPDDRFLFLTKNPQNIKLWGPWPDNDWVGVSAWDSKSAWNAYAELSIVKAKVKYLSLEPLLGQVDTRMIVNNFPGNISWLIIGGLSRGKNPDDLVSWVKEIVEAADKAKIPVFLKNNLYRTLAEAGAKWAFIPAGMNLRQERPEGLKCPSK